MPLLQVLRESHGSGQAASMKYGQIKEWSEENSKDCPAEVHNCWRLTLVLDHLGMNFFFGPYEK